MNKKMNNLPSRKVLRNPNRTRIETEIIIIVEIRKTEVLIKMANKLLKMEASRKVNPNRVEEIAEITISETEEERKADKTGSNKPISTLLRLNRSLRSKSQ